jgi:hypothetical protein
MAGAACRLACFSASGSISLHLQRLRFDTGLLSSMAARPHLRAGVRGGGGGGGGADLDVRFLGASAAATSAMKDEWE